MPLYKFIEPIKISGVVYYICKLLIIYSGLLLIPLAISLIAAEFIYTLVLTLISVISLSVGYFGKKFSSEVLSSKEAIIITALSYVVFSLLGAFVFLPVTNFTNGFFESISGFTTTGLTVLDPSTLPDTLVFFRSYSQWIGGAGIIIITLVILVSPGKSASKLFRSEFGKRNLVGDVKNTGYIVVKIYLAFTLVGYIVYLILGAGFFDSAIYVFSTFSTGGFAPYNQSAAYYNSPLLHTAMIIFMILGATSFSTTYNLTKKGIKSLKESFELRYMLVLIFFFTILFYAAWGFDTDKILSSFFHSTTALTTTGFSIENNSEWTPAVKLLNIFLMITGGSSESTAGGVKIIRFVLLFYLVRWVIYKLLLPNEAKVPIKVGSYSFKDVEIKKTISFFAVYILILFLATVIFVYYGYNVTDSLFENSSALGTVGLSTGITNSALSPVLKYILILEMWAGRLEIFPLLVLLYPRIWFKGGK